MTMDAAHLDGDDVRLGSRLIVAPVAGVFRPHPPGPAFPDPASGSAGVVRRGDVIGIVDAPGRQVEVASCFSGRFRGLLAESGERVRPGQPLAWLEDGALGAAGDAGADRP